MAENMVAEEKTNISQQKRFSKSMVALDYSG